MVLRVGRASNLKESLEPFDCVIKVFFWNNLKPGHIIDQLEDNLVISR
jgi:hypothetical protein